MKKMRIAILTTFSSLVIAYIFIKYDNLLYFKKSVHNQQGFGELDQNAYAPPKRESLDFGTFRPEPGMRSFDLLPEGEKEFDMNQWYLDYHRTGWSEAISDWRLFGEFKIKSLAHCYQHHANNDVGYQGFWDGYCEAKRAILARRLDQ